MWLSGMTVCGLVSLIIDFEDDSGSTFEDYSYYGSLIDDFRNDKKESMMTVNLGSCFRSE